MVNEDRNIEIDLIGNTGLRNPIRIHDGFQAFSQSKYIGRLHGTDNEINFMKYLSQKGVIHNKPGKDLSGSHARKWRLMFERYGFIYGDSSLQLLSRLLIAPSQCLQSLEQCA